MEDRATIKCENIRGAATLIVEQWQKEWADFPLTVNQMGHKIRKEIGRATENPVGYTRYGGPLDEGDVQFVDVPGSDRSVALVKTELVTLGTTFGPLTCYISFVRREGNVHLTVRRTCGNEALRQWADAASSSRAMRDEDRNATQVLHGGAWDSNRRRH